MCGKVKDEKDGNSYLSCVKLCSSKCVCVCVCVRLCMYMCVMFQYVTGFRLSPSLHHDSSVKQGLI